MKFKKYLLITILISVLISPRTGYTQQLTPDLRGWACCLIPAIPLILLYQSIEDLYESIEDWVIGDPPFNGFRRPMGITTDGTCLYVACDLIQKVSIATGIVTFPDIFHKREDNEQYSLYNYRYPEGIAADNNNLYIADTKYNDIRKINKNSYQIEIIAGAWWKEDSLSSNYENRYSDGIGTSAYFYNPTGITTDGKYLYVSDNGNHRIRMIAIDTNEVTTIAGSTNRQEYGQAASGDVDGTGAVARFNSPEGITTDGTNLYVADSGNNKIRKIVISTGVVTTFAGDILKGNTDGSGSAARFNKPCGITTDGTNLFVADTGNNRIRKIVIATGQVTTLAGSSKGYANGIGTSALFNEPHGITTDGIHLYVADTNNNRIRKMVIETGVVTSVSDSYEYFKF